MRYSEACQFSSICSLISPLIVAHSPTKPGAHSLTFGSEADRDAYLPHPAHTNFGATFVRPCVDGVFVFDYWSLDGDSQPSGPRKGSLRRTVAARFPEGSSAAEREAVYAGGDSFAQVSASSV